MAVDIGASIGLLPLQLLECCPAITTIIAIEPTPGSMLFLQRNLELNHCQPLPTKATAVEGRTDPVAAQAYLHAGGATITTIPAAITAVTSDDDLVLHASSSSPGENSCLPHHKRAQNTKLLACARWCYRHLGRATDNDDSNDNNGGHASQDSMLNSTNHTLSVDDTTLLLDDVNQLEQQLLAMKVGAAEGRRDLRVALAAGMATLEAVRCPRHAMPRDGRSCVVCLGRTAQMSWIQSRCPPYRSVVRWTASA